MLSNGTLSVNGLKYNSLCKIISDINVPGKKSIPFLPIMSETALRLGIVFRSIVQYITPQNILHMATYSRTQSIQCIDIQVI